MEEVWRRCMEEEYGGGAVCGAVWRRRSMEEEKYGGADVRSAEKH
jgi:hypothetical protein